MLTGSGSLSQIPLRLMHPLADFRRKSFFSSYYLYIGAAIALTFIAVYRGAWAQSSTKTPATITDQLSTEERLRKAGWWPTKGTFQRDQFVGSDTCARCHPALARTQRVSAMAKS